MSKQSRKSYKLSKRIRNELRQLGARARGREDEGDPLWIWIGLEVRRILGEYLTEDQRTAAAGIVTKAMRPTNDFQEWMTHQSVWINCGDAPGTLTEHAQYLIREIEHGDSDPRLYPVNSSLGAVLGIANQPTPTTESLPDGCVRVCVGDRCGIVSSWHLVEPKIRQLQKPPPQPQSQP